MARITMGQWIKRAMHDEDKDGPCTAFSIFHLTQAGKVEAHGVKLKAGQQWDAETLATLFRERAESHVQDLPGQQKFVLYAFYSNRSEPQAQLPFYVSNGTELLNGETEPPTPEGDRQQKMRHSEAGFQFWGRMVQENVGVTLSLVQELSKMNRELMSENREAVMLAKTVMFEQAKAQHELRMKELEFQRSAQDRALLMKYGGAIINDITGKEIIPQNLADSELLELFFDEAGEDQIKQLSGLLPAKLMGPLAARASQYFKKKLEAEKLAKESVAGRPDPVLGDGSE